MTAATRHFHGLRSYIASGALKFDFRFDTTLRSFGEGLNVRIRGTSILKPVKLLKIENRPCTPL